LSADLITINETLPCAIASWVISEGTTARSSGARVRIATFFAAFSLALLVVIITGRWTRESTGIEARGIGEPKRVGVGVQVCVETPSQPYRIALDIPADLRTVVPEVVVMVVRLLVEVLPREVSCKGSV
jgi:hypothetical protein